MPNALQNLNKQAQNITGPASIDAALAALSPEEQQMVLQGIDPYGQDMSQVSPAAPINANMGLRPEDRIAIGQGLQQILSTIGDPSNENDAAAVMSIQNAIQALGVGGM